MDPRPATSVHYPPFKNGRYFEEYFHDYWTTTKFPGKNRFVHLDIFWHNLFNNMTPQAVAPALAPPVAKICHTAAQQGKQPFTVCQWDDGTCLGPLEPANLKVFSLGKSTDVAMPLIVEDTDAKLLSMPRLPFAQRSILCSFVGTVTHPVRQIMAKTLATSPGFVMHTKNEWNAHVPDALAQLFVDTTRNSKFALAPRGYGPSSFRFFEIMQLGVIPVYIHDGDNALPFRDVVDYDKFCIQLHINDVHSLPAMLAAIGEAEYEAMLLELEAAAPNFTMQGACEHVRRILEAGVS